MPVLFCEKCGRRTTWILLGDVAAYCKSCGWRMSMDDFRAYRSRVLMVEFEMFLERERAKNPLEELYDELEAAVNSNPKLAEEVHKRNMKQLERLARKVRRRKRAILVVPA